MVIQGNSQRAGSVISDLRGRPGRPRTPLCIPGIEITGIAGSCSATLTLQARSTSRFVLNLYSTTTTRRSAIWACIRRTAAARFPSMPSSTLKRIGLRAVRPARSRVPGRITCAGLRNAPPRRRAAGPARARRRTLRRRVRAAAAPARRHPRPSARSACRYPCTGPRRRTSRCS